MGMSMEEVGRSLLSEVEEVNLSEILNALHPPSTTISATSTSQHHHPYSLPIPELASLLQPPLSTTTTTTPNAPPTPILELTSTHSQVGKTTLIYHALAHAVLPRLPPSLQAASPATGTTGKDGASTGEGKGRGKLRAGRAGTAILLDCDGTFSVTRLVEIMRGYLLSSSPSMPTIPLSPTDHKTIETTITYALRHIHILTPTSLASLIATLHSLRSYLFDTSPHYSTNRHLTLLAIDGMTAFHALERYDAHFSPHSSTSDTAPAPAPEPAPATSTELLSALKAFHSAFAKTPILLTTSASPSSSITLPGTNTRTRTGPRSLLHPSFSSILTHRLMIRRAPVPRFRGGIGVQGAEGDRVQRREVVRRGRCVVGLLGGGRAEVEFWLTRGRLSFAHPSDKQ